MRIRTDAKQKNTKDEGKKFLSTDTQKVLNRVDFWGHNEFNLAELIRKIEIKIYTVCSTTSSKYPI